MDHGLKLVRPMWELPKIRGTLFGVLIIRILLISGTILGSPIFGNHHVAVTTRETSVVLHAKLTPLSESESPGPMPASP